MSREAVPLVAVGGNPNTGKTTLFNALTRSRARVGNYPGVTVERRTARTEIAGVGPVEVVDIPGAYSVVARSAEEQIAVEALLGLSGCPKPNVAVICVAATQLVRGLYLALQAQELGASTIIALTMTDEAGETAPDAHRLSRELGCPVVPVVATSGRGIDELKQAMAAALAGGGKRPVWRWTPSEALAGEIARVRRALPDDWPRNDAMALWALMSIGDDDELVDIPDALRDVVTGCRLDGAAVDDEAICGRYGWLDAEVAPLLRGEPHHPLTEKVDRILIHRVGGFAVFLLIMFVVFQALFAWADPAITVIEGVFAWLAGVAANYLPAGVFADFVANGLIAGVGSVMVFLPQILLLFLVIGIMEDSGYMARVAYLMDRIMRSMNLHGRAFVPMLSGFACAVPAILATRTLERRRDRLLTMMVIPLMTCSARLPVYTLMIAALFPARDILGIFPVQGLLMVLMYLFSVTVALVATWVLSRTLRSLRGKRLPFVIELPPYRMPKMSVVVRMMWQRSSVFLKEAGTVILACTIVLWALLSFPRTLDNPSIDYPAAIAAAESAEEIEALEQERQGELLRKSYGGRLGRVIEPVIEPLGFDWQIGVGIIGAFAAREVFVSTMGVVYSAGDAVDEDSPTLRQRIREARRQDGTLIYSPLVGLSLMVFFALACQCMSTLAAVKRETGGWRWPLFLLGYMTVLAWTASFAVYQGGRLLGFG